MLKLVAISAKKSEALPSNLPPDSLRLSASAEETAHLPFASMTIGSNPAVMHHSELADVGLYLVAERAMLNRPLSELSESELPVSIGIFPMVAHPDLGPSASDQHWQMQHGPLALEVHTCMTHYYQLQVLHRFSGPEWHGLALCCFATEDDLRYRFFNSAAGEKAIALDVRRFADTQNSPRRVIASVALNAQ